MIEAKEFQVEGTAWAKALRLGTALSSWSGRGGSVFRLFRLMSETGEGEAA